MHQDLCGNPVLSDSQYKQAVALGRSLRYKYPVEGLDEVARKKVFARANKEFSSKVKGGSVIFVNGAMNFLHYNSMLRIG